MVSKIEPTGLGESLNVSFTCNGCEKWSLVYQGSPFVEGSKRTVVGLALAVGFSCLAMDLQTSIELQGTGI